MSEYSFSLRTKVTVILSDPLLGSYLVEALLASFCEVSLVVADVNYWRTKMSYLVENQSLHIQDLSSLGHETIKYLILSAGIIKNENDLKVLSRIEECINQETVLLTVLPYSTDSTSEKNLVLKVFKHFSYLQNLKSIFLGDLYGPRMILGDNPFSEKLRQIALDGNVVVTTDQFYFPTFAPDAAKQIVKTLFGFGVKEGVLYYSHSIKEKELPTFFRRFYALQVTEDKSKTVRQFFNTQKRFLIETDVYQSYVETFRWFVQNQTEVVKPKKLKIINENDSVPKKINKLNINKINLNFAYSIAFVFIIPFLLLFLSITTTLFGINELKNSDFKNTTRLLSFATKTNSISSSLFLLYTKVPAVGSVFNSTYRLTQIIDKVTKTTSETVIFIETSNTFFSNVLGNVDYDLNSVSTKMATLAGDLYIDLGFIQSETSSLGIYTKYFNSILTKVDIESARHKLLIAQEGLKLLPSMLGAEKPTTYMVLFQNNMEIRPTGGFIGSFALLGFDKGKFINFEVYDVYDADGQLKGFVSPPEAIRKYLNEPSWFLRDANWDPDFPSSASKIEWFLQKELGRSVDGVVAVDLSVAHTLVSALGSIYLPDFGKEINADNFYQETQNAAESNFFPGSDKKRNFLTAVTRAIMLQISEKGIENKTALLKNISSNLEARHIQMYIKEPKIKEFISDYGIDGSIVVPSCVVKNCQGDLLAVVDANLGVNKSNYYVTKSLNLDIQENSGHLNKVLKIDYSNSAPINSQNSYKNYLRIVVPTDSVFSSVLIDGQPVNYEINDVSGRREVGVMLEVPEDTKRTIEFYWSQQLNIAPGEEGLYQFLLRKQGGTQSDPVFVNFGISGITDLSGVTGALTNGGAYSYNTTLTGDIITKLKINK